MYEGVLEAIRGYQRAKEFVLRNCSKQFQRKARLYTEKGNKFVQSVIPWSETVPTAVQKCFKKFKELNWRNRFAECQLTFVYILWPAGGDSRYRFWKCLQILQMFWTDLKMLSHKNCANCAKFSCSEELVLLDTSRNCTTAKPIELVVPLAKFYINCRVLCLW